MAQGRNCCLLYTYGNYVTEQKDARGKIVRTETDPQRGTTMSVTDAKGQTVTYAYDNLRPLGREGFTGTGRTQDQPVGVFELLAVNHDHVVGQRVQPVVQSFAALKKLLRGERHENRCAGSGQPALDLHRCV